MKTQTAIDIQAARDEAASLGLDCTIQGTDDGMLIMMGTGEDEPAAGLPAALRIIQAYAALLPLTITAQGGTSFAVRRGERNYGLMEFGSLRADGQYEQDDDEVIDAARAKFGVSASVPAVVR